VRSSKILCVCIIAAFVSFSALAQGLPSASRPEEVGFSSQRLTRLTEAFQEEVDKGAIPGAVVLIARKGKVAYFEAIGFQNRENKQPMRTDAIFRIASMSKPITSVAVMMLVEEGRIQLLDPVSRYLPEFKGVQVGVEKLNTTTGNSELVGEPPRQEMTIQDLLRHTSGLTYGIFGKSVNSGTPDQAVAWTRRHRSRRSALRAPGPGTTWEYSHSTDVLGRIVEVVSGTNPRPIRCRPDR
jgi:CubicO group peptidase (beta-lactamase class C family)